MILNLMKIVYRVKSFYFDVYIFNVSRRWNGVKIVFELFLFLFLVCFCYKVIVRNYLIKIYVCNGDRGVIMSMLIVGVIKEIVCLENYYGIGMEREIIVEFNLIKCILKGRNMLVLNLVKY